MTRDNMKKRHLNKPEDCIFCAEKESIYHLFFKCTVASQIWPVISQFFKVDIGYDYLSVAKFWVANKKHAVLNSVCAAFIWCLWKFRNSMIFNGQTWIDIRQVWRMTLLSIQRWKLIFKEHMLPEVDRFCDMVTQILRSFPALEV